MTLAGLGQDVADDVPVPWVNLISVVFFDVVGNVTTMVGIILAGSGLYQVIYSSIIIFCAMLSWFFLNKPVSGMQWGAILLISAGLAVSSMGGDEPTSAEDGEQLGGSTKLLGIAVTLISTMSYAATYIINEATLVRKDGAPSPTTLCAQTGESGMLVVGTYLLLYTIPNWDSLVRDPMYEASGSPYIVLFCLLLMFFSAYVHMWSYFILVKSAGAVATGVLQALRSVGVFIVSSTLFCKYHSGQCFTSEKGISTVLVVLGVVAFSVASARAAAAKAAPADVRVADEELGEKTEGASRDVQKTSAATKVNKESKGKAKEKVAKD